MTHKILHIIAALFTAAAAALVLPYFCKSSPTFFSHLYTDVVYSEILQDFIFSRYEYVDRDGQTTAYTVYRDSRGNRIDRSAVDSLCPLNNATQLAFENRFPDTICGVAVTARQAEEAVFRHRISMPALDYGLYDLVDSHSYLSQKFNTQDLLRFTATGLEFLLPESNSIDTAKTRIFDRALAESGFEAPMTRIWSPSNRTDIEQQGFFLNDRNGRLFRLSMTEGAPVVEPLARPDDKEVLLMSFGDEEDFLAIVVTTDGSSYLMPRDSVSYQRLPLPSFTGKSVSLSGNLFYYFFTLDSADSTEYVVVDKSLRPVNRHTLAHPAPDRAFKAADYLLPVRITQSASSGIGLRWGDPARFLLVNVVLAIVTLLLRRRQGYKLPVLVIDTLLVLLLGLCGMAGAFAIPYRRNDKKENLPL